jgi:iron complex transport system substrate-binding protein
MPARRPATALALLLLSAACGRTEGAPATHDTARAEEVRTFEDADGRSVRLDVPVRRVVSLVPSATLTLDAIGARSVLVARTDYDTASWASDLPSVGGGLEPSLETIVSLHPDVVIRFGGPQDPKTPGRLDDLGVPHVAIRPDDIEDVLAIVDLLGRMTGHEEGADSLATRVRRELEAVRARWAEAPPVRAAYVMGGDPPWVAGAGTYVDELIAVAGGTNVFADLGTLYAAVSPEELVARDVDVVLLSRGSAFDRSLTGGARVVEVGDVVGIPGPSVAEAARVVARALHGGGS